MFSMEPDCTLEGSLGYRGGCYAISTGPYTLFYCKGCFTCRRYSHAGGTLLVGELAA